MALQSPVIPALPSTAPLNPADLLNETEASASLNIAVQTMRNWRWKGEGPIFVKLNKRAVRYRRADLDAFVEAGTSGKAA